VGEGINSQRRPEVLTAEGNRGEEKKNGEENGKETIAVEKFRGPRA